MKNTLQILIIVLLLLSGIPYLSASELQSNEALISNIDKSIADIEAFEQNHKSNQRVYIAKLVNSSEYALVVEAAENSLSDEIYATYNLLFDNNRRLIRHSEVPTSLSGDSSDKRTHYFDENGKTIMFDRYACDYTFRHCVACRYYFDSNFNTIKKSILTTDLNNKPLSKVKELDVPSLDKYNHKLMQSSYTQLQKRINRDLIVLNKNRIKALKSEKEEKIRRAKFEEEYARYVRRERTKDIIRTSLYTFSALSVALAVVLFIMKKIKSNRVKGS